MPLGPFLTLIGNIMVGVGVLILAFAFGRITVRDAGSGPNSFSFSLDMGTLTAALVVAGLGIIVRALGTFLTRKD